MTELIARLNKQRMDEKRVMTSQSYFSDLSVFRILERQTKNRDERERFGLADLGGIENHFGGIGHFDARRRAILGRILVGCRRS